MLGNIILIVISVLLFGYLLYALLKPENFAEPMDDWLLVTVPAEGVVMSTLMPMTELVASSATAGTTE